VTIVSAFHPRPGDAADPRPFIFFFASIAICAAAAFGPAIMEQIGLPLPVRALTAGVLRALGNASIIAIWTPLLIHISKRFLHAPIPLTLSQATSLVPCVFLAASSLLCTRVLLSAAGARAR
jgi:hypothetical protein